MVSAQVSPEVQHPKSKQVFVEEGEWRCVILLAQGDFGRAAPISGGQRGALGTVWLLLAGLGASPHLEPAEMPGGRSCSCVSHLHPLSLDLGFVYPDKLNHISLPACCQLLYIDPQ